MSKKQLRIETFHSDEAKIETIGALEEIGWEVVDEDYYSLTFEGTGKACSQAKLNRTIDYLREEGNIESYDVRVVKKQDELIKAYRDIYNNAFDLNEVEDDIGSIAMKQFLERYAAELGELSGHELVALLVQTLS